MCMRGHAQQCKCACSWVPGDAMPFRLLNKKLTEEIFMSMPPAPKIGPVSCCTYYLYISFFIEKAERHGITRQPLGPVSCRTYYSYISFFIEKAERHGIARHP